MTSSPSLVLQTPRLTMRPWRLEDRGAFYSINSEPSVQRFLSPLTRVASDEMLTRIERHFAEHGWGFWALEERESRELIGMCGIAHVSLKGPLASDVELSWRISTGRQGRGLAREAAEASVWFGLNVLKLPRLVAWTVPANTASWGLMRRLGMREIGGFDHPSLPDGHRLKQHVLYEVTRC
jgi:RimJ/RimL family protein N-acetyltransferase